MTLIKSTSKVLVLVLLLVLLLALLPVIAVAGLPDPGMTISPGRTALVLTDPQNDFLSPEGVTWGVVGTSVTANNTVEHIGQLLKAAKKNDIPVFISPHYYYPTDDGWKFGGAVETMIVMEAFGRSLALEPYLATVILGGGVIREGGDERRRSTGPRPVHHGPAQPGLLQVERRIQCGRRGRSQAYRNIPPTAPANVKRAIHAPPPICA